MNSFQSASEKREWIERTLLALREGHGSVAEVRELRALLERDREARLIYLRANQLDCMLASAGQESATLPAKATGGWRLRRSHVVSGLIGAGLAAAVVLMATLGPFGKQGTPVSGPPAEIPVANLLSNHEAVISGEAATGPKAFGEGALSLDRGIAQLAFRNGAQIVLEGRCGFEIVDEMTVVLKHGKMWAYCPEQAQGFKVLTPSGREIIDLGTEFGVEVSPTGETDVHVFDGLVDVVDPSSQPQRIVAGGALSWSGTSAPGSPGVADFEKFVTAGDLAQKRLRAHHAEMLARDDLLLYYDFSDRRGRRATNKAPTPAKGTDARILGAIPVTGRTEDEGALLFERPEDGVAFRLERPQEVTEFTIALWVKVDRLETALSTLLNSDGWDPGDIHFQITREGHLRAGMHGGRAFQCRTSSVRPGKWQLLAVTWDLRNVTARLSCDGKPLETSLRPNGEPVSTDLDPQFGDCRIGSWGNRPPGMAQSVRDFKGRIDEVMIFDHALSAEELAALYAGGRP